MNVLRFLLDSYISMCHVNLCYLCILLILPFTVHLCSCPLCLPPNSGADIKDCFVCVCVEGFTKTASESAASKKVFLEPTHHLSQTLLQCSGVKRWKMIKNNKWQGPWQQLYSQQPYLSMHPRRSDVRKRLTKIDERL